jgi:probable HAF family extracellular repeat protein
VLTDVGAQDVGYSAALAINASGLVVGYRGHGDWGQNMRPVEWRNGIATELPTLGGAGMATAVNDAGQIVGWSESGSCYNDGLYSYDYHAVLWETDGVLRDLGNLGCGHPTWALGINNAGQVVGASAFCEDGVGCNWVTAFLYRDGVMTDLNDVLSPPAPSCSETPSFNCYFFSGFRVTAAWAINDVGQIVTWSTDGAYRLDPSDGRPR